MVEEMSEQTSEQTLLPPIPDISVGAIVVEQGRHGIRATRKDGKVEVFLFGEFQQKNWPAASMVMAIQDWAKNASILEYKRILDIIEPWFPKKFEMKLN